MLLQVPHTGCLFFLEASCPSPHHHIANISHSGGEKVSSFALLENVYSLNSVLMPEKKKKKKLAELSPGKQPLTIQTWKKWRVLFVEIGTSGGVYLGKQDFFFLTTHQHLHTLKSNKIPENTLIFYIMGNLPDSWAVHFMPQKWSEFTKASLLYMHIFDLTVALPGSDSGPHFTDETPKGPESLKTCPTSHSLSLHCLPTHIYPPCFCLNLNSFCFSVCLPATSLCIMSFSIPGGR